MINVKSLIRLYLDCIIYYDYNSRHNTHILIAEEGEHWEYIENMLKHQEVCRHDYRGPANKEYADDQIKHCRKCHKTKRK